MTSNAVELNVYTRTPFDYGTLDAETAERARTAAERIRTNYKAAAVDIGRELIAMKAALDAGLFLKWVEAEFDFSRRTAVNLMHTAQVFGESWETVSHLPSAVIYQLASPSTPETIREAVVEAGAQGKCASPAIVKRLIRQAREKARKLPRRGSAEREQLQGRWAKQAAREDAARQKRHDAAQPMVAQAVEAVEAALGDRLSAVRHLYAQLKALRCTHLLTNALEEMLAS